MSNAIHTKPPQWPLKFLRFFLKKEYVEEIEGDMEEMYADHVEQLGKRKARRKYIWDMVKLFRPILLKNISTVNPHYHHAMFKNYFKVSFRNILRNPMSSFINVIGLSVALGICVVVYSFVEYAYGIDNFHENKNSVYLTTFFIKNNGTEEQYGTTPRPLGEMLRDDFSQVKKVCRVEDRDAVLKLDDKVFRERIRFVDPEFLEMLTFSLKWGTASSLRDINSIILSEEMSIKYFGNENPVGRDILMIFNEGNSKALKVTGVAAAFPKAHAIDFQFLINFENLRSVVPDYNSDWKSFVNATLIEVENPSDLKAIEKGMNKYKTLQNEAKQDWAISSFSFISLADLYRQSGSIKSDISMNPPIEAQIALPIIAIFMLVLACFNYINMAIVSATRRLKEIGVRKVIGASKAKVVVQFLTENLLVTFLAGLIGLGLAATVFIPWFVQLTSRPLELNLIDKDLWLYLVAILFVTGLISGMYPAFYISRFEAIKIFKGSLQFGNKNPLTKIFLGFQLILACILITGSVVFTQNTEHQTEQSWGYNHDQTLYARVSDQASVEKLRDAMSQHADVVSMSLSMHHLGKSDAITSVHLTDRDYEVQQLAVDANYFATMELPLKEGRVFAERSENDKQTVVVNELLVNEMGWTQPIGQLLEIDQIKYEVIGVVSNFHHRSFYYEIRPTIFTVTNQQDYRYLSVRVKPGSEKETYADLQAHWLKLFPETPFDGNYQQDVWGIFFEQLDIQERFARVIAIVAMLLASLGLYGLVTLNVSGRTREFSIRKVLGAGAGNLAGNITRQYVVLALTAMIIGAPVSYLLIKGLLQMMYAYPLPIGLSGITIAVGILVAVLLSVVSTQIIKVLKANPVEGLKIE